MIVEVDAPKFANEEEVTPSMYDDQLRRDLRKDGGCYSAFTEVSEGELYVAETYEVRLSPSLLVWGG